MERLQLSCSSPKLYSEYPGIPEVLQPGAPQPWVPYHSRLHFGDGPPFILEGHSQSPQGLKSGAPMVVGVLQKDPGCPQRTRGQGAGRASRRPRPGSPYSGEDESMGSRCGWLGFCWSTAWTPRCTCIKGQLPLLHGIWRFSIGSWGCAGAFWLCFSFEKFWWFGLDGLSCSSLLGVPLQNFGGLALAFLREPCGGPFEGAAYLENMESLSEALKRVLGVLNIGPH